MKEEGGCKVNIDPLPTCGNCGWLDKGRSVCSLYCGNLGKRGFPRVGGIQQYNPTKNGNVYSGKSYKLENKNGEYYRHQVCIDAERKWQFE